MAGNVDVDVPKLMSGAGHDAMAMAHLTKVRFASLVYCINIFISSSCMRRSHGETTLKQEAHKLRVSVFRLLNQNMRHVSR